MDLVLINNETENTFLTSHGFWYFGSVCVWTANVQSKLPGVLTQKTCEIKTNVKRKWTSALAASLRMKAVLLKWHVTSYLLFVITWKGETSRLLKQQQKKKTLRRVWSRMTLNMLQDDGSWLSVLQLCFIRFTQAICQWMSRRLFYVNIGFLQQSCFVSHRFNTTV